MLISVAISSGPQFFALVPWIIFFPVIGLLINMFFGGWILRRSKAGEKIVGGIASTASGVAFVISLLQALSLMGHPEGAIVPLADWITIGSLHVRWAVGSGTMRALSASS